VNVYDPADKVLYVHIAREMDPYSTPLEGGPTYHRLPVGYANRSLRTCLKGEMRASEALCASRRHRVEQGIDTAWLMAGWASTSIQPAGP
jgi:hypothetical protein